ncbi:MAG: hypothetical protein IIB65_12025 [Proteobacteria bacterium]|nr:hypothetical protein [Pseudomonadota bacterium]MCH8092640.1 hypothetical protein [Pseudomonadota bacterium]MCH8096679.1 hypothetical protein [Pseudomonadota bacterium]
MTQSSTTTAEFLKTDLQGLGSIVTAARGFVADGKIVDLAPLEQEIKRICDRITSLPADQNVPLKPVMVALIDDLDKLATEIRDTHSELKGQLQSFSNHTNAVAAYVKGGGTRK